MVSGCLLAHKKLALLLFSGEFPMVRVQKRWKVNLSCLNLIIYQGHSNTVHTLSVSDDFLLAFHMKQRIMRNRIAKYVKWKQDYSLGIDVSQSYCADIDCCLNLITELVQLAGVDKDAKVKETVENSVVFEQIRELLKVLQKKHKIWLKVWTGLLLSVSDASSVFNHSELKELNFIQEDYDSDLKLAVSFQNRIYSVEKTCVDLNVHSVEQPVGEFDTEEFVDVNPDLAALPETKSSDEVSNGTSITKKRRLESSEKLAVEGANVVSGSSTQTLSRYDAEDDPLSEFYKGTEVLNGSNVDVKGKEKAVEHDDITKDLLQKAPVVEYDDDLYYWDKDEVSFNQTGISFHHRFYGETEDRTVPQSTLDNLRKRRVLFRQNSIEVQEDDDGKEAEKAGDTAGVVKEQLHPLMRKPEKVKGTVIQRLKRKLNSSSSKRIIQSEEDREFEQRLRNRSTHRW
jgi:hypothetical protein